MYVLKTYKPCAVRRWDYKSPLTSPNNGNYNFEMVSKKREKYFCIPLVFYEFLFHRFRGLFVTSLLWFAYRFSHGCVCLDILHAIIIHDS